MTTFLTRYLSLTLVLLGIFEVAALSAEKKAAPAKNDTQKTTPVSAPSPETEKLHKYLDGLFTASRDVNHKDTAKRKAARDAIEQALDWDRIAKDCLGDFQWKSATDAQRKQYSALLKDVIIRTAYTRLDTFWEGATYQFTQTTFMKGGRADVRAKYTTKDDTLELDYYLVKQGNKWLIYDIAFEEIRYSDNIREQLRAFLREKGFPELLSRLKQRRDKLIEESTTAKS